jgi:hypothetical protein
MIKNTLVTASSVTNPDLVYTSSSTGAPIVSPVTGQTNAITTIVLCNIGAPSASDETVNDVVVNVYVAPQGVGAQSSGATCNLIVSNLTVPAGETVFLSEERIVLDPGDEIYVGTDTANLLCVTVSSLPV